MDELHRAAQQGDAPVGIGALGAILEVALDGAAYLGKLATYLMMTARLEVHFDKGVVVGTPDDAIVELGTFAARHFVVVGVGLVLLLIAHQPMDESSLRLFGRVLHNGPVALEHLSASKHRIEPRESLGGAGEHDKSCHRTIQTVHNTEEHVAGLGVGFLDVLLDDLAQGLVAGLVALHNFTSRLGDDDDVVVFVYYLHWNELRVENLQLRIEN